MAQSKSLDHFYSLLDQYKQAAFPNKLNEELSPAATLDLFNNVNYDKSISDQQVIEILVVGCKQLGHQHTLSRSFCQFLYKQLSKQIRVTSFRPAQFDTCIKYIMDGLDNITDSTEHKVDLLRALSALVFENASNTQRSITRLSKILLGLANRSTKPLEIRRMAINCIGNTCAGSSQSKIQPFFRDFYACLLENICTVDRTAQGTIMVASTSLDFTDTAVRKIASSTLRALQFLLSQDKTLVTNPLCDIIEIIYTFIFMHVNVQSYAIVPQTVNANTRRNPLTQPTAVLVNNTRPTLQLSWRTPLQHKYLNPTVSSSESELSDSGTFAELSPRRQKDNAKIRINALLCLSAIATSTPKALYPHWHKFLPDTLSIFLSNNVIHGEIPSVLKSDNQPYSLFTILLYDPAQNVRAAVCTTLMSMLDGSKQYLSLALESEKSKTSFTTLSENLGSIIRDIHKGIVLALGKEYTTQILSMIMNVTTILIENCSYERLSKSHLLSIYHAIKVHWNEPNLCSPVLKVITCIFSVQQVNLQELIQTDLVDGILLTAVTHTDQEIQAEGWRTCSVITKNYYAQTMPALWKKLMTATQDQLPITAESLKFVESYANAMEEHQHYDEGWWKIMIESYLHKASSDDSPHVRVAACDCFASIPKEVFEKFHYRYHRLAITLLFSLASDKDANVRAAACRTLGVFVLFPSMREDPLFVSDMIKATLNQKDDKATVVRVRATWAIANLCDALVLESDRADFSLREYMCTAEWIEILGVVTAGALDNDKLRSNAVRAIGSLLRITPKEYYDNTRIMSLVRNAMDGLEKNIESGALKIRWNACHATSNMLLNDHFPIGFMDGGGVYPWTHTLYQSLIQSLLQCKNFKVRINACLALTTAKNQNQYGDKMTLIVKSILEAWEICQKNQEYKEAKYKQQLEKQIIESLVHIKDWIPIQFKEQANKIITNKINE